MVLSLFIVSFYLYICFVVVVAVVVVVLVVVLKPTHLRVYHIIKCCP